MRATICSGYFRPVKASRPFSPAGIGLKGGGNHTFNIPAAEKNGEWPTLVVEDMLDRMYLLEKKFAEVPVYGEAIAKDLVNEWRNAIYGGEHGGPAIFVCKGDKPTADEKAHWAGLQRRWANWIYLKAEEKSLAGRPGDINDLDREVAAFLGRNPKWMREDVQVSTRPCPVCTTEINSLAMICPACKTIVDHQRYFEFLEKNKDLQAKIASLEREAELERLTAPGAPLPPPIDPKQAKKPQPVGA